MFSVRVRRLDTCLAGSLITLLLLSGCATTGADGNRSAGAAPAGTGANETGDRAGDRAGDGSTRSLELLGTRNNYELEIEAAGAPGSFSDAVRRRTLVGRWQRRTDYDPIQFDGLVARLSDEIQAILRNDGFFNAKVAVDAVPAKGSERPKVLVKVERGPASTVGAVELQITGPAATDPELADLKSIPDLLPGDAFVAATWQSSKRALIDRLNRHGYLRAAIRDSEARVRVAEQRVDLDLAIDSGPQLAFGALKVEGVDRYDERIIEDLRTFRPGEPYSDAKLQDFLTRLRSSGYFASASALPDLAALQRDPAAAQVPIDVVVAELKRRRAVFGVGYSTDEGARGQVGFEHRDLLGKGLRLESALSIATRRQLAFAHFRTPYDAQDRFFGFGQRIENEDIEGLEALRSNTYAGVGRRQGDIESFTSLQFQVERQHYPDGPDGPGERNSQRALVLGHSWNLRRVDSVVDPTRGYTMSLQLSGAREGILTDRSFARVYTRLRWFDPMPKEGRLRDGTLLLGLELGYVAASSREDIPSENLFRAGGVQSLRGYSYQSLGLHRNGATLGGRYLAIATAEYQHRLNPTYAVAGFIDYGNAGDSTSDFDPVAGYGLGLRVRTPIGPLNLDVAYGQAAHRFRIHFSIGYTF